MQKILRLFYYRSVEQELSWKKGGWNTFYYSYRLGKAPAIPCSLPQLSRLLPISISWVLLQCCVIAFLSIRLPSLLFLLYCRAVTSSLQFSHAILYNLIRISLVTRMSPQNTLQPCRSFARKSHKVTLKQCFKSQVKKNSQATRGGKNNKRKSTHIKVGNREG